MGYRWRECLYCISFFPSSYILVLRALCGPSKVCRIGVREGLDVYRKRRKEGRREVGKCKVGMRKERKKRGNEAGRVETMTEQIASSPLSRGPKL